VLAASPILPGFTSFEVMAAGLYGFTGFDKSTDFISAMVGFPTVEDETAPVAAIFVSASSFVNTAADDGVAGLEDGTSDAPIFVFIFAIPAETGFAAVVAIVEAAAGFDVVALLSVFGSTGFISFGFTDTPLFVTTPDTCPVAFDGVGDLVSLTVLLSGESADFVATGLSFDTPE